MAHRRLLVLPVASALFVTSGGQLPPTAATPERVVVNDNRAAAGTLRGGTLTIRLAVREGDWHPDADSAAGVTMRTFALEGGAPRIPGPMIRVAQGTIIHAFVHNSLSQSITVHGLNDRALTSVGADTLSIAAGATREVSFTAGRLGTFFYWAATDPAATLASRFGEDSQLSGAFIVDPSGAPPASDRVLVLGLWSRASVNAAAPDAFDRITINGKSWPHTERLTYGLGDSVRIRALNVGAGVHPMHLHGFYFALNSRGAEQVDSIFTAKDSPRSAVTERLPPGRTFSMTWVPTRAGNWLFHCHDPIHLEPRNSLGAGPSAKSDTHAMEMMTDMAGPVLGITVRERSGARQQADPVATRHLRLVAMADTGGTKAEPAFRYRLEERGATMAMTPRPTIVLKRGEPVAITIVNQLRQATTVHWHGIELESYYDGVAGFAGRAGHLAPAIAAGDSFVARFTPPRSGTFMYHPHLSEVAQQQAGLGGALIVVDDPATHNAATDLVMLVNVPRAESDGDKVLLNGALNPAPIDLTVGVTYRVRLVNQHNYRPSMIFRIMRDSSLQSWKPLAKDGMDLPPALMKPRASAQQLGNGETYDFEFTPGAPGELRFDVTSGVGVVLSTVKLRVKPAGS